MKNFKIVCKLVPPRVAACLLKAGLHGWSTAHRVGQFFHTCRLCHQFSDNLGHIATCSIMRRVWRATMQGTAFCPWFALGFINAEWPKAVRAQAACVLFAVHECHRYRSHHVCPPSNNEEETTTSVLLFAVHSLGNERAAVVKQFVQRCKAAIGDAG